MKISPPIAVAILIIAVIALVFSLMKSGVVGSAPKMPLGPPSQAMGKAGGPKGAAPAGAAGGGASPAPSRP